MNNPKKEPLETVLVTIRIPLEDLNVIDCIAYEQRTSRSAIIRKSVLEIKKKVSA